MKKLVFRCLSFIIAIFLIFGAFPLSTLAASVTYYQTSKADVPIWSQANSNSTKIKTISTKGTVLKVTASTTNSSGNLWYKLSDGYWVYSGNVTKHSHAYKGGICTGQSCGYEYPYSVSSFSATVVVTNSSGAKIWSRPYSNNSTHIRTEPVNKVLSIVAKTTNQENHIWLKTSDGYWVYSGNVTRRYTVKYNANGGSGAPSSQTYLSGKSITISSKQPTRTGYVFQGWATSSSASSADYKAGKSYSISGSKTLYAVWKTCKHSNYTGGYCDTCNYEYPYSVTSFSATVVVTNSSGAKIWSRPYSNNSTHIRTEPVNKVLSIVAKTTNQEGNIWLKTSDGYWVYSGNVTRRYTVSYNANGGSGAPSSQTYLSGKSITISSKQPTRTGYVFQGWATSSSASSASYKAGKSYTLSGNKTLYAVWKTCKHDSYKDGYCKSCGYEYKLKITSMSGTFVVTNDAGAKVWSRPYSGKSTNLRTENYKAVLTVKAKTTNSAGKLWYQLSDDSWVYSGNVTRRYTVKYNANGGSGAPSSQAYLSGKSITISSKKPTRTGYVFQGWATSSSASSASYKAGKSYTLSGNKTLYAVWKTCKHDSYKDGYCKSCGYEYKLKITSMSGTFVVTNDAGAKVWSRPYSGKSTNLRTEKYKAVLSVKAKTTNSAGKLWYQLSDGSWIYSEHITQRFTITYNANGGSKAPSKQTFLSGKTAKLSKTKPKRPKYIFKGWSTSKDSKKVRYNPGDAFSKKQNLKLYAVWEKCSHKKYVGGYCTTCNYEYPLETKSLNYTVCVTNKDGAKIWSRPYSKKSNNIKTLKKNTSFTVIGKTTNQENNVWYKLSDGNWVYSNSVKRQFTVSYDAKGGTNAPKAQKFLSGETLNLSTTKPTKSGYIFQGWSTSSKAKKVNYKPGSAYSKKANLKLYAVWNSCEKHKYNNYGLCKNCGYEWLYKEETKGVNKIVHTVNSSNDIAMYKRPYQNPKEKVKVLKKGTPVLVVAKATNRNDQVWYKLNNGYWMKAENLKKKTTYNTMENIQYKSFDILSSAKHSSKKINGEWYYIFKKNNSVVYLAAKALTGAENNPHLEKINNQLSDGVNAVNPGGKTLSFVYIDRTKQTKYCHDNRNAKYDEYVWVLTYMSVETIRTQTESLTLKCKRHESISFIYTSHDIAAYDERYSNPIKKPTTNTEYKKCLSTPTILSAEIMPTFKVTTTQMPPKYIAGSNELMHRGYFTAFSVNGVGRVDKKITVYDSIEMLTGTIDLVGSLVEVVLTPTPKSIYSALKEVWGFSKAQGTSEYHSEEFTLAHIEDNNKTFMPYQIKIKSPIFLESKGDYCEIKLQTMGYVEGQKFKITLDLS